jgi:RHS repeat-associated protein
VAPIGGAWHVIKSSDATTTVTYLGSPGDKPAPGDYDGDAHADPAVFRPGVGAWYVRSATGTTENIDWGLTNDTPVPADYDGDRTVDVAVWRPAGGTWFTRRSGSSVYAYDTRGNRTSSTPLAGSQSAYGYDQANRLISAPGATYAYNGDGLRTSKTVAGTTARFTWDTSGGMPMLLDDGTYSYIYGPDGLPLEQIDRAGVVTWYHHDQLGSTRTLTSSTGAVVGTATYDSYGRLAAHSGTLGRFGFAGEYTDAETGFVYLRARYYDPATGQFISRDPIESLTREPYGYVAGNPLNDVDPSGLCGFLGNGPCTPGGVASDLRDRAGDAGQFVQRQASNFMIGCQMYCDDLSNYASAITFGSALLCPATGVTCFVASVAAPISLGASAAHSITTCIDGIDAYCARSLGAFGWDAAIAGMGAGAKAAMRGTEPAFSHEADWLANLIFGGPSNLSTLMNTTERPNTISRRSPGYCR